MLDDGQKGKRLEMAAARHTAGEIERVAGTR
jgi:hypothetical protein